MRHQQICSYGMLAVSACSCMVWDMSELVGRRERKKAETRLALASAAMRLALEHGVENVTAEAIADAADVAPRTFHNYFSSKEEAIVSEMAESLARLADGVRAAPAGEPVWDVLQNAMVAAVSGSPKELAELAAKIRMINANPSLLAARLALFDQVGRVLAPTIAARTGTDVEHDLYPRMVAIAAMVAMNTALDMWLKSQGRASPIELTTDAFTQLRAGLPEPHLRT
jgi:AcrR family transcriptional regulator